MMNKEFEALVSYLHVVEGRPVNTPPVGALAQSAPPTASPTRERDSFFTLVLPANGPPVQPVFYERMAKLAAERYFASGGGVTATLRDVLFSLNTDLFTHNQGHAEHPFYADFVCVVLRKNEVYIARTGCGLTLLWQGGALQSFPPLNDSALTSGQPLGVAEQPGLTVTRYRVLDGDLLALSGPEPASLAVAGLQPCGVAGDVQATVTALKELGLPAATMMVMQFVAPEAPEPAPEDPPVAAMPPDLVPLAAPPEPVATQPETPVEAAQSLPDVVADTPPAAEPVPEQPAKRSRRFWQRGRRSQGRGAGHVSPPSEHRAASQQDEGGGLQTLLERGRTSQKSLAEAASAARPRLQQLQAESQNVVMRAILGVLWLLQRMLIRLADSLSALSKMLGRLLPAPEPGKPPTLPTPVAASAAMLIPLVVAVLVVAFALNTRDETAFERCLSTAQQAVEAAERSEQANPDSAVESWFGVIDVVNQCLPRRPDDPVLLDIRRQAQTRLDDYSQVVRCPTVLLRNYPPGAEIRGPILRNGVDLYTLDTTRSVVYRDRLNELGNALVSESEVIVQHGSAVGDYVVDDLVDIAWLTESGGARGSLLVALDKSGYLLTYSPTFPPAAGQPLVGTGQWGNPVAIDSWQGRIYILDPIADQVWRYQPSGGTFPSAPEEYFIGDNRPDLSAAVDLAIDLNGNVYILFRDGTIHKFYAGEEQFFQFSNLPNGAFGSLGSANAMYLDTGLISPGFYVLDAANQIAYETTLGGTFSKSYRAPQDVASFRDLSGLTVDPSAEHMYLAARDMLYYVSRCGD